MSRIAEEDNDFFGLHAPDNGALPEQIGTDTASQDARVRIPVFPDPGFATSGAAFQKTKGNLVRGVSDSTIFASSLSSYGGFGAGDPSYVAKLANVIANFALRLPCLKK